MAARVGDRLSCGSRADAAARPPPVTRPPPLAAPLAALLAACAVRGPAIHPAHALAPEAEVNRTFEIPVAVPIGDRRPDEVVVRAEVIAPSGARSRISGFPLEHGFAVRYRPREPGEYRYRVLADWGRGSRQVREGEFRAEDRGAPGQVEVRDGALVLEDGRPFRALGESRFDLRDPRWSDELAPETHVARMARYGMNTLRISVLAGCGRAGAPDRPGCLEPEPGRFDPIAARRYDAIFAAADRHGLKVILTLFASGFARGDPGQAREENAREAERGSPAAPEGFFTDPAAREAARRRLRYAMARWSASPALLAVDLLGEPGRGGAIPEPLWIAWAEDLAHTWKAEDPYAHPVTAGPVDLDRSAAADIAWWASPRCDVVQWHRSGEEPHDVHALARALVDTIRDTARLGKPVLVGEPAPGGEPGPVYDRTHVGIWAVSFAGAGVVARAAPPPARGADAPTPPERGRRFQVLADLLARAERRGPLQPADDPPTSPPGLRALLLAGAEVAALWLHGPALGYGEVVKGAQVTVRGLAPGRWRVEWIDDVTGERVATEERILDGEAVLSVPPFVWHVAAMLEKVEGPEREQQARRGEPAVGRGGRAR